MGVPSWSSTTHLMFVPPRSSPRCEVTAAHPTVGGTLARWATRGRHLHEARTVDGGVPRPHARAGCGLGRGERIRDAGDRLLARRRGRAAPLRGRLAHRHRATRQRGRTGHSRDAQRARARHLVARLLPEPPASRPGPPRRGQRAPRPRRRSRHAARRRGRRDVHRRRPGALAEREPSLLRRAVAAHGRSGDGQGREDRDRELPDAVLGRRMAVRHEPGAHAARSGASCSTSSPTPASASTSTRRTWSGR